MSRASHNYRRFLVRGVVSTIMVLPGEEPLHATVSIGGVGGLLSSTGALSDSTL